jgi:hypothetical protein
MLDKRRRWRELGRDEKIMVAACVAGIVVLMLIEIIRAVT